MPRQLATRILTSEQSGLLARIAATESGSLCKRMKSCAIRRFKAHGGFAIKPPRRSKTLGGSIGPTLSTSYRDDGELDCPVAALA